MRIINTRRFVVILFLVSGLGIVGFLWLAPQQAGERRFFWPRLLYGHKADNADNATVVKPMLRELADYTVAYFKVCDGPEWRATCQLQSTKAIWRSISKKLDVSIEENDPWGDPFGFEISRLSNNNTMIRVVSKGNGPPLNGSRLYIELQFDGIQKTITQKESWNSDVSTIPMPKKNDGWD